MAGLTLDAVTKSYGAVRVIEDLSLTAEAGELIVFLGPSGCGKSTLLRAIAGLESIDSGAIHIGDRRVDHLPPGARGVAMVFQHYALYPHMTVRENMAFGLRNARVPAEEIGRRIEEASTSLEIAPLLDRKPGQLSGGQRQRVAIARATVKEPELFLLDEPLSNLDAALRIRTRLELAQLHRRLNTTMIFVTHDQVEAMTLADRIVVLNGGGIEQIAPPMEVYRRPCTRFVAEFVGSPKINIHSATISPGDDGFANARLGCGALLKTGVKMQDFPGQTATLGIRPEHVRICAADTADATGMVMVVERLGERTLVHTRLPDSTLLVAEDAGSTEVRMGDTVGLTINGSCAHLFDKDGLGYHAEERPR